MKVKEVLKKRLKADGWYQVRMMGSHRILAHPTKSGIVGDTLEEVQENFKEVIALYLELNLPKGYL